jgi:uncharacterized protein YcbK (DUF882 family)
MSEPLSKHFTLAEFACRCCRRVKVSPRLVKALEELRELAGAPITVTSGYRCPTHNRAVGGKPRSQHVEGIAADIRIGALTVEEMYRLALQVSAFLNGGIGVYPQEGFIHVDTRRARARWARIDGAYVGIPAEFFRPVSNP